MGVPQIQPDGKMEGWLYIIRFNRFGLQTSRKKYFILEDKCLKSFKSKPNSALQEPVRSAIIDSCIRVTDNGRKSYHGKVFFIFTLHNSTCHNDQLKFGASSAEEAARWICSLQDIAMNPSKNFVACSKRKWKTVRLNFSKSMAHKNPLDWASASSVLMDAMKSDVTAPSPWRIFGLQNGLRLFKEVKNSYFRRMKWGEHPAIMAVGVVDGTSEAVFRTLMSLGSSRSEWDFCLHKANVVEQLDGHADIVHMQLCNDWLPWGMKRRDLLLQRYWRMEDDGTYVILYQSVYHKKCPPQGGFVRASLKSGGYVITPVNHGKESIVRHMLAIDWKIWRHYVRKVSGRSITIRMLGRVAALRELFRANAGNYSSEFSSMEIPEDIGVPQSIKQNVEMEVKNSEQLIDIEDKMEDGPERATSGTSSLMELNDADDEFFDVPEPSENDWSSDLCSNLQYPLTYHPRLSSASGFVKKLQGLTVQKKGYMDLQEVAWEENVSCRYGATLAKDNSCNLPCSWTTADPSTFLIRGHSYLEDHQKTKANSTIMQLVAADWLRSDKHEDDLGSRTGGIVQKYAAKGGPEFFFIVNIQFPGSAAYTLALYFMTRTPLEETPLLERFVNGDDAYRNSRFKLIPYVAEGAWIVKQSVRKKACLLGEALAINYHRGKNYLELAVDVGSSAVARGVTNLVLGYLNNLIVELAFLIQANTEEELPEVLLGTCRLNHLDVSKTVVVTP